MAKTPEGKVKDRVKAVLKKYNVYSFMPVQAGYGASTLDFLCCHKGRFFAIETKAPGKKPTERQQIVISQITDADGVVFIIDGETYDLEDYLAS